MTLHTSSEETKCKHISSDLLPDGEGRRRVEGNLFLLLHAIFLRRIINFHRQRIPDRFVTIYTSSLQLIKHLFLTLEKNGVGWGNGCIRFLERVKQGWVAKNIPEAMLTSA